MLERVDFNLPTFALHNDLMTQEVFGYYEYKGVKLSVHLFRVESAFKPLWLIQVYGEHYVFQDLLAKAEMPAESELYAVLRKANDLTVETAKARLEVAA